MMEGQERILLWWCIEVVCCGVEGGWGEYGCGDVHEWCVLWVTERQGRW